MILFEFELKIHQFELQCSIKLNLNFDQNESRISISKTNYSIQNVQTHSSPTVSHNQHHALDYSEFKIVKCLFGWAEKRFFDLIWELSRIWWVHAQLDPPASSALEPKKRIETVANLSVRTFFSARRAMCSCVLAIMGQNCFWVGLICRRCQWVALKCCSIGAFFSISDDGIELKI